MPPPKSPEHLALGDVLREARLAAGLSQDGLAERSGLNRVYFGSVERGEINIAWTNLLAILGALELGVAEFGRRYERASKARARRVS